MKLAFNSQAHYTDFSKGYELYRRRNDGKELLDETTYRRAVKAYCKLLAKQLCERGIVDLPNDMGSIAAAEITRKPQYRGKKFIGYGKMNWETGRYDGNLKAFGMVFFPKRNKNRNLRCFGYVANRQLFKKVKKIYESDDCRWRLMKFNDEMI